MTRYNILIGGKVIHENLSQDDYFNKIEDLAQDFYIDGMPDPTSITTQFIED